MIETIIIIIILLFSFNYNFNSINGLKYMTIKEIIDLNIKLFLIKNAGLISLDKNGSKLLEILSNDKILIKTHRNLNNKYGKIVKTYISTRRNYYILDTDLAKQILLDSPLLFDPGELKEEFFSKFMPNNLGISKCNKNKCPWKNRRKFNEKVLATQLWNPFLNCLTKIVNHNIDKIPLDINDFKSLSHKITSHIIYGTNKDKLLKKFMNLIKSENILETKFYKKYQKELESSYKKAPKCSLLYYANLYKNDKKEIINDQIPHWFGPFMFIISFLIPNLLCIIINFKDIHKHLLQEINSKDFEIYSKETFLHYCVIEHIRLFNTININIQRTVKKDVIYSGIQFKKNDQLFILFSSILRNKNEFKNPDSYYPERWINKSINEQEIVFGIGPQQCPSKQITPLLYKILLKKLLQYNYKNVYPKLTIKKLYFLNPYDIKFSI